MASKQFGHIGGIAVGTPFPDRTALAAAGVHPPLMTGIHGTKKEGSDSIVVSGGYVDDQDLGDVIIYTGMGSNDPQTKRQVKDQDIDLSGNAGLITSELAGLPVRVSRGAHKDSTHAPAAGFRYDGLYAVTQHWTDVGKDGFAIIRFRLEKLPDQEPSAGPAPIADAPSYSTTRVVRRIRDSAMARAVKAWHNDECQVCGEALDIGGGRRYSEGAHIRPLGQPHVGPDVTSNILCLCPNHHTQLDYGGLRIEKDLTVRNSVTLASLGKLRTRTQHQLDPESLEYRRQILP